MKRARILLGDDQPLILEALESILCKDFDVVGVASDGRELVKEARRLQPDAVVLDISMPGLNGFEAAREIKEILPAVKLLFLTQTADQSYVDAAFALGASAYVVKQAAARELVNALGEALAGRFYCSSQLRGKAAASATHN